MVATTPIKPSARAMPYFAAESQGGDNKRERESVSERERQIERWIEKSIEQQRTGG
jgi:hypothetical protein